MINFVTYNRKVYPTSESIWEFLILWVVEIFYCSYKHSFIIIFMSMKIQYTSINLPGSAKCKTLKKFVCS